MKRVTIWLAGLVLAASVTVSALRKYRGFRTYLERKYPDRKYPDTDGSVNKTE